MPPTCEYRDRRPADSWEHIVLKAFGGKHGVGDLPCEPCNNQLGAAIDHPFELAFRQTSLMVGTLTGNGEPVGDMDVLNTLTNEKVRIVHGGLRQNRKPVNVNLTTPDGNVVSKALHRYDPDTIAQIVVGLSRRFNGTASPVVVTTGTTRYDDVSSALLVRIGSR